MGKLTEAMRLMGIRHPIVQGPFGGGLSTVRLAAAVADLGGLGSFGAHTLAPDEIGGVVRAIRAATNGPFALNLWVSDHDPGGLSLTQAAFDRAYRLFEPYFRELGVPEPRQPERFHQRYDDQIAALVEAAPPVISFIFGVPSPDVLAQCRKRGIVTIGTATTLAEAQALDEAGLDLIVAT
ncbi:MAG: nitronate monooxygenase, partial [Alphaproteobacteria bacterium]|nr:nitronate monooxygenase [Alphaproteobacteria bacterium]